MLLVGISTTIDSYAGVTATRTQTNGVLARFIKGESVVFRCNYTINSGTAPTFDVKIQHAPSDTSTEYVDLVAFAQVTATSGSGVLEVHLPSATMGIFPHLRAVSTITGTLNVDATVTIHTN